MVAQFVRLKLTLLAGAFRRSVWQTIGIVLGSLYALSMVAAAVVGAVVGGTLDVTATGKVLVVAGSVLVLGWWLVPVLLYGVDATLDPRALVTYGIPRRSLLAGLGVAGVITVPGLATALTVLGVAFAWWRSPPALLAGLIGAAGALALCVVGSRALTTALAPLLERRRSREVLAVVVILPLLLLGPLITWVTDRVAEAGEHGGDGAARLLDDAAGLLGWTPLGAPWGLAAAVQAGDWLAALGRLAVLVAAVGALAWVWDRALTRSFERPAAAGGKGARVKGLGLLGRVPATPTGAVLARTATYWVRDPRYSISFVVLAALPVVFGITSQATDGEGAVALILLAPLAGWVLGFGISNDIGYDHTAFALHVSTGVPGKADRWGRALPVLVGGGLLVPAFVTLTVVLSGNGHWAVPLLGLSLGTLLMGTGVSSYASARWPYPVPKPGQSPLSTPQGSTGATMVAQSISMGLSLALSVPSIVLTVLALALPSALLGWIGLAVGPGIGLAVLLLGVHLGAQTYDRRAPELLQQVMSYA